MHAVINVNIFLVRYIHINSIRQLLLVYSDQNILTVVTRN